VLSTAARLLLPMIAPQDVDMIIERELMKTNDSPSVAGRAVNVLSHGHPTVPANSVKDGVSSALKSIIDAEQQSAAVPGRDVGHGLVSDGCDGKNSRRSPTYSGPSNLQTKYCETFTADRRSYVGEEWQLRYKLDPTTDIKKSDGNDLSSEHDSRPSMHCVAVSSSLAGGGVEIPLKSSTTLAGLCKRRLSSDEINNNCRRRGSEQLGSNIRVGCDAAGVRKSQRCNRGRRYLELMPRHRTSRKHSDSVTL